MSILNESPVVGLQFSILSPDEIRRMSVVEVVNRETYVNNKAVSGGSSTRGWGRPSLAASARPTG